MEYGRYGVAFVPIWSCEDDGPERIVDVEAAVVSTYPTNATRNIGGVRCVEAWPRMWFPLSSFPVLDDLWEDDTHNLRDRGFNTRQEAEEHMRYTLERFHNPQPWESFVKVS